ncbi:MAG: glycosyl hydrolase [Chloroflexota bacterium]
MKPRAIALSTLPAFVILLALLTLLWGGVNNNSSLAYPAPSDSGSTTQSAYPPPGANLPAALNFAYPPPQPDPTITVTVEPRMRLPLLGGLSYSPKKGLAWGAAHLYPYDYAKLNVSWVYNWEYRPAKFDATSPLSGTHASEMLPGGVEYIPMIYCVDDNKDRDGDGLSDDIEDVRDYLGTDDGLTSTWDGYLLILNEPWTQSECGGTLTTMRQVTEAYVDIRDTFPNAKLIGPNIHNNSYDLGLLDDWREDVSAVTDDYPDVVGFGIHTYTGDPVQNRSRIDGLHEDLVYWQGQEGRPEPFELWVTEFAYCGLPENLSPAQDTAQTVSDLEARDFVNRYAYYANRTHPSKISSSGDCFHDDSENYFLFVRLFEEVCQQFPNCDIPYNGATDGFIHYFDSDPQRYELTAKGRAYQEAGVLR